MTENKRYFFCGIGGSGMLPLAMIVHQLGNEVEGSDRALDQGRTADKFEFLRAQGIKLHPQDGSGITDPAQILVTSTAVEDTVPDVRAARALGAAEIIRAELLAQLFNAAERSIAIGGTSGKSTTTGMVGWILSEAKLNPTIINGAVMNNFMTPGLPFASAVPGDPGLIVSEVDESDGSIARFHPRIAVLNNVAFDHKPIEELRTLFANFIADAEVAIVSQDDPETRALAADLPAKKKITWSLEDRSADFLARDPAPKAHGISFKVDETKTGKNAHVSLQMPGSHNVANALAAIAAAKACGVSLEDAARSLGAFTGIRRRLELTGSANGITVIDDFAHNPDKISASLATLRAFPGRLLIMFQPHGFGPLRLLKEGFISCFANGMEEGDVLLMPEPVYFGGTVERTVTSSDITSGIEAQGRTAIALPDRAACGEKLLEIAQPGDRIIVMGARDDTLSEFAADLLDQLAD